MTVNMIEPSQVRSRIKSDSNSATIANKLKQPPHRVGRIMDPAAEAEFHVTLGQLVQDVSSIRQRPSQPVQLAHHNVSLARQALRGWP
jgi:hypothetical protein